MNIIFMEVEYIRRKSEAVYPNPSLPCTLSSINWAQKSTVESLLVLSDEFTRFTESKAKCRFLDGVKGKYSPLRGTGVQFRTSRSSELIYVHDSCLSSEY
jgi:hypothetical protein